ncbi:hypothetical protein PUNSTDRAFT_115259 [Punctularia strigosozonata HHB-11173 SS5]|uniref:uncharacterized protein n=1 Tax=Punctularia strigosozonata (strain HHB-11173) TaxID=741275 RepID=UPI0004417979|nr:uncharacterized protein PUNSTDRAFT_115259 [Punctularia strigosozonata HHB-11173 SS5]EIN06762.1 hypothetical protein PUNSTDRAFT_115259 [Punctularia strigosozonata HHB-11173 SS5]
MDYRGALRNLTEPLTHPVTVFTRENGALPGFTTSLYCRGCRTRYYPNYYVHHNATHRTYYVEPHVITVLEIGDHYYIERSLCTLFANMMVMSWCSATNCARIYNHALTRPSLDQYMPASTLRDTRRREMNVEDVWTGFCLDGLLLDFEMRHLQLGRPDTLELPQQAPSQMERMATALRERNHRMEGPGSPFWNHACDLCCKVTLGDSRKPQYVRAAVTDGITIGHPCCAYHDCKTPLHSVKDLWCPEHAHLKLKCVVVGCENNTSTGYQTCSEASHRALEAHRREAAKAVFQLKERLRRARTSQTHDSLSMDTASLPGSLDGVLEGAGLDEDEDVVVDDRGIHSGKDLIDDLPPNEDVVCDGKPAEGNVRPKARFGRRRTHNEELVVACCGTILSRATFFGSEAPNGVRNFWVQCFPTEKSMPQFMIHDNGCKVLAMIENDPDDAMRERFKNKAIVVDVFHFKLKHKESDNFCSTRCNPAQWPELMADGKWQFNMSAAEQTNAWFGGFQAIVREMQVDRYNFFLDEMIRRRNELTYMQLKEKGNAPYFIPRSTLLDP